jgi:hypothetical protein
MSKTQLILLQSDLASRVKLLKKFNGNPLRIKELKQKIHALSVQINALTQKENNLVK